MEKKLLVHLSKEQVIEIVGELLGTCHTLDYALESIGVTFEQVHPDSFYQIDAEIFRCDWCGWWNYSGDDMGSNCCPQCYDKEYEEEEELIDYPEDEEDS